MLPVSVDPRRMASQGLGLAGKIDVSRCDRLSAAVQSIVGDLVADLQFDVADQGRKVVSGHVKGQVSVLCQRCLEPMIIELHADVNVAVVWSEEEAESLPKYLDPWLVNTDTANLCELLEDELLLVLPFVSFHPLGDDAHCDALATKQMFTDTSGDKQPAKRDNPFDVLAALKPQVGDKGHH